MAQVGLVADPRFDLHVAGPGHVERPERLVWIRAALNAAGLAARCRLVEPEPALDEDLLRIHTPEHVSRIDAAGRDGLTYLDADTGIGPQSAAVARLAAGSCVAVARAVARGELRAGFAAVRPPGHHAERDRAMGFCLFNNVAVTAAALRAKEGVSRVLIVDWDVHHGNGTQHSFESDPDVLYFSVHQSPLYPGTGMPWERGVGRGVGATLNCPLAPGAGDREYLAAFSEQLVPAAERFRPEFVLVSAGFDAHHADPLASLEVSTEAFAAATREVRAIADRHAGGRVVSVLEGGYHPDALAASVTAHLAALLD